jgi:hypothetical protein
MIGISGFNNFNPKNDFWTPLRNIVLLNSIPSFIDLLELERNLIANTQGGSVDAFAAILLKCNDNFLACVHQLNHVPRLVHLCPSLKYCTRLRVYTSSMFGDWSAGNESIFFIFVVFVPFLKSYCTLFKYGYEF